MSRDEGGVGEANKSEGAGHNAAEAAAAKQQVCRLSMPTCWVGHPLNQLTYIENPHDQVEFSHRTLYQDINGAMNWQIFVDITLYSQHPAGNCCKLLHNQPQWQRKVTGYRVATHHQSVKCY